jgi:hypothetical protein
LRAGDDNDRSPGETEMSEPSTLLPNASVLYERLTENARERHILRGLLRLRIRQEQWAKQRQGAGPERDGRREVQPCANKP